VIFDPAITKTVELAPGALGLPGEQVIWTITVTNVGTAPGYDIVITDTIRSELRIDSVEVDRGSFAISEQLIVFTIPVLNPGESATMRITTTVLRGPADGLLTNEALLTGDGPNGTIMRSAKAEISVPTGLPATGYPPEEDLPGEDGPSVWLVGLVAFAVVALTALFVWRRG
jgi:uncharacterized repeat protein (TIGR01451 family)